MSKVCEKHPYPTRQEAKKNRDMLEREYKKEFDIYKCDKCNHFHLTSMTKEQSRNFKRYLKNKNNK